MHGGYEGCGGRGGRKSKVNSRRRKRNRTKKIDQDEIYKNGLGGMLVDNAADNIQITGGKEQGKEQGKGRVLVVFDIDETLIQYIGESDYRKWENKKALFEGEGYTDYLEREDPVSGRKSCILFRPMLGKLMQKLKDEGVGGDGFVVGLWTYSNRTYCQEIAKVLIDRYQLGEDFFLFTKGGEDIRRKDEIARTPKNLQHIFSEYSHLGFGKHNTLLVDDRSANICHKGNGLNGICIQPFSPFGVEDERVEMSDAYVKTQLADTSFADLMQILDAVREDVTNMGQNRQSAVFHKTRVDRMGLKKYYRNSRLGGEECNICIGNPQPVGGVSNMNLNVVGRGMIGGTHAPIDSCGCSNGR
jgi:hypothetical protein